MKKVISILLTMVLIMGLFTGYTRTKVGSTVDSSKKAPSTELNIYMWQQYISDDLIAKFEGENKVKVNLSYMGDNADAITKLVGGGQAYDLIITCDAYMVI